MNAAIDNHGLKTTGELQSQVSIYAGDVVGLLESWSLTYKSSEIFYDGPNLSREFSGSLAIPYDYWTLYLSGSCFTYESLLQGERNSFRTNGTSRYYTAELERVVHRDQVGKTRAAAFLNYKDTEDFAEGIRLDVSSRKLNVIGGRLSHSRRIFKGIMDVSFYGQWGVPMFGSLSDGDRLAGSPRAGVKFLFRTTLRRHDLVAEIFYIGEPQKIPPVMSRDEIAMLLDAAKSIKTKAMLSLAYGCGLRAAEVVRLKVGNIDSGQDIIRIIQAKGRKDRHVMSCCRMASSNSCASIGRSDQNGTTWASRPKSATCFRAGHSASR